jgi:ABC-type glutathione transport system ATPase component
VGHRELRAASGQGWLTACLSRSPCQGPAGHFGHEPVIAKSPATAEPLVFEAIGLKKDFDDGQVQALRGVDFRIDGGEFVAVTGPSGCGKTTLLQMLGGLDRPTAATIFTLS